MLYRHNVSDPNLTSKTRQNADEIDSAGENLSVESDSQANQRSQTKVLPATTTLKRKAASSEQTIVLCVCACIATKCLHFGPHPASPGLYVNTSISLPRVGEVPHLSGVPHFHVNRPLVYFAAVIRVVTQRS